jgi:hypothetical protein
LNRFKVAFASLAFFALMTSTLAGSTLFGTSIQLSSSSGGPAALATSANSASISSQLSSVYSMTVATQSVSVTFSSTGLASSSTQTTASTVTSVSTTTVIATTVTTATVAATTTPPGSTTAVAGQTTVGGGVTTLTTTAAGGIVYGVSGPSAGEGILAEAQKASLFLAPVSWVLLGGAWIWRGRVRSRYTEMGFGSDVFELFMKMKGGATRIKVLNTLSTPKDRLQLAEELGVDWKTVDRHVQILNKYGFVREQAAYGTVRLYEVTPIGKMLLNLFEDLEKTDGPITQQTRTQSPRQEDARTGT